MESIDKLYEKPIGWKILIAYLTNNYCNKSLGQCFIINYEIIKNILTKINLSNNILEIGGGSGILSYGILEYMPFNGKLTIVEKDARFIAHLKKLLFPLAIEKNIKLNIVEGDALHHEEDSDSIQIIANIPYNITSQLLYKWLQENKKYYDITIMVQKEVGEKLWKNFKENIDYSVLSVLAQATGKVKKIANLSPDSFYPAPKVNSQVINYKSNCIEKNLLLNLLKIINIAFTHPNKKIINNFQDERVIEIISSMKLNNLRPKNISPLQYLNIAEKLTN